MRKSKFLRLFLVLILAILVTACGGGGGGDAPLFDDPRPTAVISEIPSSVGIGQLVQLNGSNSSDPGGLTLSYFWSLDRPGTSSASLSSTTAENPTLIPDVAGFYTVHLFVSNGNRNSATVSRTFEAIPDPRPVANAGPDQEVNFGEEVQLDGSGSFDPSGADLTYEWAVVSQHSIQPTLNNPNSVQPTLIPGQDGVVYVVRLIVNNGTLDSLPDTVDIVVGNVPPQAVIETPSTTVTLGNEVILDGRSSTDRNDDDLLFTWSLDAKPENSQAELSPFNPAVGATNVVEAQVVSFVPDLPGNYEITLEVFDGTSTDIAQITITANEAVPNTPPVAAAGPNRKVGLGFPVDLNASPSQDPDGDELTFQWNLLQHPDGSSAQISPSTGVTAAFTPDVHGQYVVQLTASDGQDSDSTEVTITAIPAFFRTYGGAGFEEARAIAVLPDGYLIAGESDSPGISQSGNWDLTVFRTDLAGRVIDTLVFGDEGLDETWAMALDPTGTHIALAGYTTSLNGDDAFIIEASLESGEEVFDWFFEGENFDMAQAVIYTSDGGLLACGYSESADFGPGGSAIFAAKISEDGQNQFFRGFVEDGYIDCWAVAETAQGYYLAGVNDALAPSNGHAYLLRIDKTTGEFQWQEFFGTEDAFDEFFALTPTRSAGLEDGGLMAVGYTESFEADLFGGMYLVKLPPGFDGDAPPAPVEKALVREFCSEGRGVEQIEGGFIVGGFADFSGNFCVQNEDLVDADAYLVKVDANLNVIWERLYGGIDRSLARAVKQTADGGFLLGGDTNAFGPGSRAMLLIKTDAEGRVPPIVLQPLSPVTQNAGTPVNISTQDSFAMVEHAVDQLDFLERELSFSAIGLPEGLSINVETGVISGTLAAPAGVYPITVIAKDHPDDALALSAAATFTLTVN
ncbi:PKD domain-containing protein [Geoalkalibacter halelectricus]|uniref:PKD domain-containing protein n=1 Tax=Geoalkalibacter halelectricus TaxID=2847045 RepID=UPI0026708892|nr:PKD domain-containing protein [Geoalkalibacter halelectricus]MDO3376964.1 PKD domain-containing protein [Geoalkalibacter halelectricus]